MAEDTLGGVFGSTVSGTGNVIQGPTGPQGPQGIGIEEVVANRVGDTTVLTISFNNPDPNGTDPIDVTIGIPDGADGSNGMDGLTVTGVSVNTNGTLRVALSDGTFLDTAASVVGADGEEGPRGPQGHQGRYTVKVYTRSATIPAIPENFQWRESDNTLLNNTGPNTWFLTVPAAGGTVEQVWEAEGVFDPSTGQELISDWSNVFQAGAEGPDGPPGPTGATGDYYAPFSPVDSSDPTNVEVRFDRYNNDGVPQGDTIMVDFGNLQGPMGNTGATGPAPDLGIGNVTTVAVGGNATANVREVSADNYVIDLGLPTGATGSTGATGGAAATSWDIGASYDIGDIVYNQAVGDSLRLYLAIQTVVQGADTPIEDTNFWDEIPLESTDPHITTFRHVDDDTTGPLARIEELSGDHTLRFILQDGTTFDFEPQRLAGDGEWGTAADIADTTDPEHYGRYPTAEAVREYLAGSLNGKQDQIQVDANGIASFTDQDGNTQQVNLGAATFATYTDSTSIDFSPDEVNNTVTADVILTSGPVFDEFATKQDNLTYDATGNTLLVPGQNSNMPIDLGSSGDQPVPSSSPGIDTDPILQTLTFENEDGTTTRWRIVEGTPVSVLAPTPSGSSFTQYADITPKVVTFTVQEPGELITAVDNLTVLQTGFTFTEGTDYTITDLSGGGVSQFVVTISNYDNQDVRNIRISGDFTVQEGEATNTFANVEAIVNAQGAPATSASVTYQNNADIPQFFDATGLVTMTLVANNGAFSGTVPDPIIMQGTTAITPTLTTNLPGEHAWTFNRAEIDTDVRTDVTITWDNVNIQPTGKTDTSSPDSRDPSPDETIRITQLSNTLTFSATPNAIQNLFALTSSSTFNAAYTHTLSPADSSGTYTLNGTASPIALTATSTNISYTNVDLGINSLNVSYNDTRDDTYDITSSSDSITVFVPWYFWSAVDTAAFPTTVSQSDVVVTNGSIENGLLSSSVNEHEHAVTASSHNVFAAIPSSLGVTSLTGTAEKSGAMGPFTAVMLGTTTQMPAIALNDAAASYEYQIWWLGATTAAAGTTNYTLNIQ